jgi:hypothetical protein
MWVLLILVFVAYVVDGKKMKVVAEKNRRERKT